MHERDAGTDWQQGSNQADRDDSPAHRSEIREVDLESRKKEEKQHPKLRKGLTDDRHVARRLEHPQVDRRRNNAENGRAKQNAAEHLPYHGRLPESAQELTEHQGKCQHGGQLKSEPHEIM